MDILKYRLVLVEGHRGASEHALRHILIPGQSVAVLKPEVERVVRVHRCHEVVGEVDKGGVRQGVVVAAGAGGRVDRLVDRNRGRTAFVVLLAIAIALEPDELLVIGRGGPVGDPAPDDDAILRLGDLQGNVVRSRAREGCQMNPGDMARVQKVVGNPKIVARDLKRAATGLSPGRVVVVRNIQDCRRIGLRGIARPDPHEPVAFRQRKGMDPRALRYGAVLGRRGHAGPRPVKGQPVIAADHPVPLQRPLRQGQLAMRTGVLQRHRAAIAPSEKDDLFSEKSQRAQIPPEVLAPARDIPGVARKLARKHRSLPSRTLLHHALADV